VWQYDIYDWSESNVSRRLSTLLLLTLALVRPVSADDLTLLGEWVLNAELSQEQQPKKKSGGGGGFSPNVSVGGIYIPLPGGGGESGGTPIKTPDAAYAKTVTISREDDDIVVHYHKLGKDTYVEGNIQGTKTRWSTRKLTSSFKTTSTSVKESFEVEDDGRLHVTIKINPKSGSTRTFKRVFERTDTNSTRADDGSPKES
jgi:hypothetical protein